MGDGPVIDLDDVLVAIVTDGPLGPLAKLGDKGDNSKPQLVFHDVFLWVEPKEIIRGHQLSVERGLTSRSIGFPKSTARSCLRRVMQEVGQRRTGGLCGGGRRLYRFGGEWKSGQHRVLR